MRRGGVAVALQDLAMTEMERALARRRAMASGEIWADMIVDGKLWLGA
eukprot:COSAG01_NODE_67733_length_266_cov_0.616766_1_plen_47_part_01